MLEVQTSGDSAHGRYFYRRHHFDIPIDGTVQRDGALALSEGITGSAGATATMLLRQNGAGAWRGTWTDSKGRKSLTVKLSQLAADPVKSALPTGAPTLALYERERMRDLPLIADNLETVGGRKLQWWAEPVTGARGFRVKSGYPAATLAQLNGRLSQEQNRAIAQFFECNFRHASRYGERSDFEYKMTPRLLSDQLVSITFSTVGECGSGEVQVMQSALNVQVPTMRELELTDLLGGAGGKSAQGPSDFPSWLGAVMNQLDPLDMADLKERCGIDETDSWRAPYWFITPQGLSLEPALPPRKRAPCGGEWLLPGAFVKQHPGKLAVGLP